MQLRGRTSELEAELAEQRHLKQQAQDESEFLRAELEELKKQREDTEKAQRSLTEIESERGEPAPGLGGGVSPQGGGAGCSPRRPCACGRAGAGQRAAVQQAEGEVQRAGAEPRRPAAQGGLPKPLASPFPAVPPDTGGSPSSLSTIGRMQR